MTDAVAIGPAILTEELVREGAITRCRGSQGSEDVEILLMDADAPADERAAFQRAHDALTRSEQPDVVPTRWVGTLEDGRIAAVREWTTPAVAPADPTSAVDAMRRLVPAVRAAGEALLAETSARDLRRRDDGRLAVAPWGARSTADTAHRAPEAHRRGPSTEQAALYGLGVWLYQGLTEHLPVPSGARSDEASATPPTKWRPDLPYNLSHALMALLANEPGTRPTALKRLDTHAPPATAVPGTVKLTTRAADSTQPARNARVDTLDAAPGAVLSVSARALSALSPAQQSALAGWAELPLSEIRDAIMAGRSLPISGQATRAAAIQQQTSIRPLVDAPITLSTPPSALRLLGLAALAAVGAGVIGLAALLGVWWVALFSLVFFALGLVSAGTWVAGARAFRNVSGALPEPPALQVPALKRAIKRTSALRRRLATLELPATAAVDVREAISAIEDQIDAIARVHVTIDDPVALEASMAPVRSAIDALEANLPTEARLLPEGRLDQVHHATRAVREAMSGRSL